MEPPSPPASPRRGGRAQAQQEASDEVLLTEPTLLQRLIKAASRRENAEVRSAALRGALAAAPALHRSRACAVPLPRAGPLRALRRRCLRAVLCRHGGVACCVCGRFAGADGARCGGSAARSAQTLRLARGALNSGARHAGRRVHRRRRLEPDQGGVVRGDELAEQPRGCRCTGAARSVHLPARRGGPPRRAGQLRQVRRQQRRAGAGAHRAGAPLFRGAGCMRGPRVR